MIVHITAWHGTHAYLACWADKVAVVVLLAAGTAMVRMLWAALILDDTNYTCAAAEMVLMWAASMLAEVM